MHQKPPPGMSFRALLASGLLAGLALLFPNPPCLAYQGQDPGAGRRVIDLRSRPPYYSPNRTVVEVGTTVVWKNADNSNMHTVNAVNGAFRSPEITAEKSWSHEFRRPGTYHYACRFHPWMRGSLVVEDRRLDDLSVHDLPQGWQGAALIGVDGKGKAWFGVAGGKPAAPGRPGSVDRVVRIDEQGKVSGFRLPAQVAQPWQIAVSSSAKLWILHSAGQLYEVDESGGQAGLYRPFSGQPASVGGMSIDAQGKIWISLPEENQLAVFDTRSKSSQRHDLPEPGVMPGLLANGSEGWVYFAARGGSRLGAFSPSERVYKEYALSGESRITSLHAAERGVWFADPDGNQIGRLREGWITEYTLPTPFSGPHHIAVDSSGAVWISQRLASKIGVLKEGRFREFALQDRSEPQRLGVDSRGNVWFTELNSRHIKRIPNRSRLYPAAPQSDSKEH